MNIYRLPKDVQKYILEYVSYPYKMQKKELLQDIRDFSESLKMLYKIFTTKTMDDMIGINRSQDDIEYTINYNIYYNILVELDNPNVSSFYIHSNYFYSVLFRLFMFNYNWYLKFQYDDIDDYNIINNNNIQKLKNKIRFLFGIMNVHERFSMIFYHYQESIEEDEDENDYDY